MKKKLLFLLGIYSIFSTLNINELKIKNAKIGVFNNFSKSYYNKLTINIEIENNSKIYSSFNINNSFVTINKFIGINKNNNSAIFLSERFNTNRKCF